MKKTAVALAVLAILACGTSALLAQGPEDAKFKKFQDAFWDAYFKFYPTAGTIQGYTKYNDKLEDPSEGSLERFTVTLNDFRNEIITKIDKTKLSADLQLEHEMFMDFIDLEGENLAIDGPWESNPLLYNQLFVQSLRGLLIKNGAAGIASATNRAKLIPGLVKRAKDNLKKAAPEYTQAAIDQMPAIIDFYRMEISKLSGGAPALQTEVVKAVTALEDYQRFLKGDLLAKSTGTFRMGDVHMQYLQRTTQGTLPIKEVLGPQAKADLNNIRREMFIVCLPFFKLMYPNIDTEKIGVGKTEDQIRNMIIKGVLDKIKTDHVKRDEYLNHIEASAASIKSFIQQNGLINLPEDNLAIEAAPPYCVPGTWTRLMAPGAFEAGGTYTLLVKPIPAAWSAEDATFFLEEHNNHYLDFMVIQRIFPGSFVPAAFARKDPSVIKRMAPNQGLLKGWPIFLEDLFIESGFGNYDLRMRLNQLKLLLKTVIDFQVDINIHASTMTKEEAVNYMTNWGFMTKLEAELRWEQIVLNPGEGAQAYIGYQEILDMEKDYRKLKGDAFSAKDFLQKLVSYGAIPLRTLKAKMAQ